MADWIAIRAEYETTGIAQRKLAEKHGVSYPTLRDKSKREGWVKSKEETLSRIIATTLQKTVTKIATKEADRNARHLALNDLVLDAIEEYLTKRLHKKHVVKVKEYIDGKADSEHLESVELDAPDTKALHNIVSALEKAQRGQRLALGLDTEHHKIDGLPTIIKGEDKIAD